MAKTSFVRTAQRLGFFRSAHDARAADTLILEDTENPSQDIIVQAGLLTEQQAAAVVEARKNVDMQGHLDDRYRAAHRALSESSEATARVIRVARPGRSTSQVKIP